MRNRVMSSIFLFVAASVFGQENETAAPAPKAAAFAVERATSAIEIDGVLDEPAWREATAVPLLYEWFPGDNTEPPVKTDAIITYDDTNLYVGFRAWDPEPSRIRAHLMDRDEIFTFVQDDHVTVMIDPFNDERRAFQFRINPLGVQADAVFSQVEFIEDFSWDIIWESAGRITETGYEVEVAIPLNQIRFPESGGVQTWGFELGRSYPRNLRHRISANPRDRNEICVLCQVNKITGFSGLEPGLNLEVVPTFTMIQTDRIDRFPGGDLEGGDEETEPGITARWGVTPAVTVSGAINPDFSQVEADAAQLAVNERFALFFEEKRSFFLEGIDFFTTPIDAVFTRTVVDPEWGVKSTGKKGKHAGGVFVAQDEVNSLVIPSNQGSAFAFLDEEVLATVARYRRDVGEGSTIGVLYTGREGDGYHNRVAGIDGFFSITPSDEIRFQYLRSDTRYPGSLAVEFGQELDAFDGDGLEISYNHTDRNWIWDASYEDLDPGFRADSGFVPRVDVKTLEGSLTRRFWGTPEDWYTNWNLNAFAERTEDHSGRLSDERFGARGSVNGPMQSTAQLTVSNDSTFFIDTLYEDLFRTELFFEMQPGSLGKYSILVRNAETVDFTNNQRADELLLVPAVELKPGRRLNAQLRHIFQSLDVDAGDLSETNISELRLVYSFSTRSFVRTILQYRDIQRTVENFAFPIAADSEQLFTQFLFSWKLNPQTVVFAGYSDNHLGVEAVDLTRTDRTFFLKLGYAWIF